MRSQAAALLAVLGAAGCSASLLAPEVCQRNDDCSQPGYVCFAEGCARPEDNLVVEVSGGNRVVTFPEEQPVLADIVGSNFPINLLGPTEVTLEFIRDTTAYTSPVTVQAVGQSELLPGLVRSLSARLTPAANGRASLLAGQGRYRISAVPGDPTVPLSLKDDVIVRQNNPVVAPFDFTRTGVALSGRVLLSRADGGIPVFVDAGPGQRLAAEMQVQAFHPTSGAPLSRVSTSSTGLFDPSSAGDYSLLLNSLAVNELERITVVVTPVGPEPIPTKSFTLTLPLRQFEDLELGDWERPARQVRGTVRDAAGAPVAGATVRATARVVGGGSYTSPPMLTAEDGRFSLTVLPPAPGQRLTLAIATPPDAAAGSVELPVALQGEELTPDVITLPAREVVRGVVLTPMGSPAPAARLEARALPTAGATPRLAAVDEASTIGQADGSFALGLDPGRWQLSVFPGPGQPTLVRILTVPLPASARGGLTLELPRGRSVSGVVSLRGSPLGGAVVRFFRVALVEGEPLPFLLGTALSDDRGLYTVVLPTR